MEQSLSCLVLKLLPTYILTMISFPHVKKKKKSPKRKEKTDRRYFGNEEGGGIVKVRMDEGVHAN